ncbi:hypothetical protein KM043_016565 [Ampulex compressa]|nr:hypothetical protein KM043_016565 [Ampulex compressa]
MDDNLRDDSADPNYRKPIDSNADIGRGTTSKNESQTTVGPFRGRGTVRPIRSDRYCTPPYNLHGLMTSITLLRALAALRTARVVRSLGHGPDTRLRLLSSRHGPTEHAEYTVYTQNTQRVRYGRPQTARHDCWFFQILPRSSTRGNLVSVKIGGWRYPFAQWNTTVVSKILV